MPFPAPAHSESTASGPAAVPDLFVAMLDAMPAFASLAREDGTLTFVNQTLRQICGWKSDTRSVRHIEAILSAAEAARLLAARSPVIARATLHAASGRELLVEWTARPLAGPDGTRFVCFCGRDLTLEAGLEEHVVTNQWFETAAALSGGIAHDFNNVLAAILGLSEIISLRLPPEHALQEYTQKIGLSVERAKVLVRRFSQFSRKNAGGAEPQPTTLLLEDVAKLLHGFFPGSITFSAELMPETPWFEADRAMLEQIIFNCANFLRARLRRDNGAVRLSCNGSANDTHITIDLHASGQGLLGLDLDSCFTLDLRPTSTAYESGTGLHVARALAQRIGARLSVMRHDPRTISFVLEIPIAP